MLRNAVADLSGNSTPFGLQLLVLSELSLVSPSSHTWFNTFGDSTIATKSIEEQREALIQRSLARRANITLCVHGINTYYCKTCEAKKAKAPKKKTKAAAAVVDTPTTAIEGATSTTVQPTE